MKTKPKKGKTVPLEKLPKNGIAVAVAGYMQQKVNETMAYPFSPGTPTPTPSKPKAPVYDISTKRRQVDASNDRVMPRRKRRGKSMGGGPPFQDSCPELKAWLAAYCEIPNGYCALRDKEKHVKASKNSRTVRLVKYGDGDFRPSLPDEWQPKETTKGWWGRRAPTLDQLFSYSRKIAEKLGPYRPDRQTVQHVVNNIGKHYVAPTWNDSSDQVLSCSDIDWFEDFVLNNQEDVAGEERHLTITRGYAQSLCRDAYQRRLNKPVSKERRSQPAKKPVQKLEPILSCCKDVSPVILGEDGLPKRQHVIDLKPDDPDGLVVIPKEAAISFKHINQDTYAEELEQFFYLSSLSRGVAESTAYAKRLYQKQVDRELCSYLSMGCEDDAVEMSTETLDLPKHISELLDQSKDYAHYWSWLRKADRNSRLNPVDPMLLEHRVRRWYNPWPSNWKPNWKDQTADLNSWLLERDVHNAPEVRTRKTVKSNADRRWNLYVAQRKRFLRGEILHETLERMAYEMWSKHFKSEVPEWILKQERIADEHSKWSELMQSADFVPEEISLGGNATLLLASKGNSGSSAEDTNLAVNHPSVTGFDDVLDSMHYIDLYFLHKKILNKLRKFSTQANAEAIRQAG